MSVAKNRKLGSILAIVGIMLLVIPLIPGAGLSLVGDPHFVQTYPSTVSGNQKQYNIYWGAGATATTTGNFYYVDPFWDQDWSTIQDARAFVDELNAGTAETYGHLEIRAVDGSSNPIPGAAVKVTGLADQTTDANGWVYYFKLPLKDYTYSITASGYQTAQGAVTLSQNGYTVQKQVSLTKSGATPGGGTTPPPSAYRVYITASAGGSVAPSGSFNVAPGGQIMLVATPATGFKFDHWVLNNNPVQTGPAYTLVVDKALSVVAVFTPLSPNPTVTEPTLGTLGIVSMIAGIALLGAGVLIMRRK